MLENLQPATRIDLPKNIKVGIEFDGFQGEATTPGYAGDKADFDAFLIDAGFDPDEIEIVGVPRTSRWQKYDGDWLTSYKFQFRKKTAGINLPMLLAEAKKQVKPYKTTDSGKCLVVLWSDLQVGKVDYRGGAVEFMQRVATMQDRLLEVCKKNRFEKIIFADLGDTVENFSNAANLQQLQSNDLSLMEQVDLAATLAWQTIKKLVKYAPVTYASIGSNHCQWRVSKQVVGKPTDDWGVFIGRQLAKLAAEANLPISFLEPQPHDESLAIDVFGDQFHVLGMVHGHQASRPDEMGRWWRGQAFGNQAVKDATILVHGHWHHLRVTELGSTPRGTSRFIVMGTTLDNGSGWWRRTTGEDSVPGLTCFILEKDREFTGTVWKL
jgi:hypothetical protein